MIPSVMGRIFPHCRAMLLALGMVLALAAQSVAQEPVQVLAGDIVHTYPHDPAAFTEGLFYLGGELYESTGMNGTSDLRRVSLETGEVLKSRPLNSAYFGEGIVADGDRLIQLTWRSHVGFIYRLRDFAPIGQFRYPGEGWALTGDETHLIMSDGTARLRFLDPATLKQTGHLDVTLNGCPIGNINELEMVKGVLLANIWQTSDIVRIDMGSGRVTGVIDLRALVHEQGASDPDDVLNGIAYDAEHDRLFVTGKRWRHLYEIRLHPAGEVLGRGACASSAG